jgi:hypothetical protein
LWETFEQLCEVFVRVLRENPGLPVSSFALDDEESKGLLQTRQKSSSRKWMPPIEVRESVARLMAEK